MSDIRIVFCNAPDFETADLIAKALVETRLAACVNLLSPCRSVYTWNNAVESADEIPMLIKTTATRLDVLIETIERMHPYEVPEILAIDIVDGLPSYCQWIHQTLSR